MRLSNRVALVTGSSRGIGRATALAFAGEGADLVINYHSRSDKAEEVVSQIKQMGRKAIALKADIADRGEVDKMVEAAIGEFGKIDILMNNAGAIRRAEFLDTSQEDWSIQLRTNLDGTFNCTQAVAKHMVKRRYGKIISVSSVMGLGLSLTRLTGYGVSKGALITFTKQVALELGKYGINVNAIAPGVILTEFTYEGRTEAEVQAHIERQKQTSMLGTVGKPEDIANVAVFLASDESAFITGQLIVADGGSMVLLSHSA
jgi:3-oxoacyl-[acyl-carrier protein] reductase